MKESTKDKILDAAVLVALAKERHDYFMDFLGKLKAGA